MDASELKQYLKAHLEIRLHEEDTRMYGQGGRHVNVYLMLDDEVISEDSISLEHDHDD